MATAIFSWLTASRITLLHRHFCCMPYFVKCIKFIVWITIWTNWSLNCKTPNVLKVCCNAIDYLTSYYELSNIFRPTANDRHSQNRTYPGTTERARLKIITMTVAIVGSITDFFRGGVWPWSIASWPCSGYNLGWSIQVQNAKRILLFCLGAFKLHVRWPHDSNTLTGHQRSSTDITPWMSNSVILWDVIFHSRLTSLIIWQNLHWNELTDAYTCMLQ